MFYWLGWAGLGWAGWAGSSLTASLDLVAAAAAGLGLKTYFLLLVNHSPGQARLQAAPCSQCLYYIFQGGAWTIHPVY